MLGILQVTAIGRLAFRAARPISLSSIGDGSQIRSGSTRRPCCNICVLAYCYVATVLIVW